MVKVNLKDGRTLSFDLADPSALDELRAALEDKRFQAGVTAMSILHDKTLHALPTPQGFTRCAYGAEALFGDGGNVTGERITAHVDDTRITITVYFGQVPRVTRTDVRRIGRARYTPPTRPVKPDASGT